MPAKKKAKKGVARGERGVGRPKKLVDWEQFNELCQIQCTQEEIAAVLNLDQETINRRCKEEFGVNFSDLYKQKREGGKASVRRAQYLAAMDPSNRAHGTMLVWLGKNLLGQTDQVKHDHSIAPETFEKVYRIKFGDDEE